MTDRRFIERVEERVDQNHEEHLGILRKLAGQPSVAVQNLGVEECASLLKELMVESGIDARIIPLAQGAGSPVVYGEVRSNREGAGTILFYGHYDVQPPEPLDLWSSPPFTPTVRDGRIFGRGVADDKGNVAARLSAVRALRSILDDLPVNLKFVFEGEEEEGSTHLPTFVDEHRDLLRADGCVWEGGELDSKGRPKFYLGMKGILYTELRIRTAETDQHSMYAPIVANPAWELVRVLSSLRSPGGGVLIPGFYDGVVEPEEEDLKLLERLEFDEEAYKKLFGIGEFHGDLKGSALKHRLIFSPTCTICGIESGYTGPGSKTVNPSRAMVKIDFRLVPGQTRRDILSKLKRHLDSIGADVELVEHAGCEPARTSPSSPIVRCMVESCRGLYDGEPQIWPLHPGSGPMSLCTEIGLDVGSGECIANPDSRYHAPNENILIKDYQRGIKHVCRMILSFRLGE